MPSLAGFLGFLALGGVVYVLIGFGADLLDAVPGIRIDTSQQAEGSSIANWLVDLVAPLAAGLIGIVALKFLFVLRYLGPTRASLLRLAAWLLPPRHRSVFAALWSADLAALSCHKARNAYIRSVITGLPKQLWALRPSSSALAQLLLTGLAPADRNAYTVPRPGSPLCGRCQELATGRAEYFSTRNVNGASRYDQGAS